VRGADPLQALPSLPQLATRLRTHRDRMRHLDLPGGGGLIRAIHPRAADVPEAFSGYLMMTREDLFPAIARHWIQAVDGGELVPPRFASVTPAPLTLPDARALPPEDSIPPTDPGPAILAHRRGGERDPRKRPLSPYADADRDPSSSSRPHARISGGSSGRGPGEKPGERGEWAHSTELMATTSGRDAESQWMRVDGEPASGASASERSRERPSQSELEGLHELSKQFCLQGDHCPLLRDRRPCPSLHSADIKALELPPWVRETALTLLRSHPYAHMTPEELEHSGATREEVKWKEGIESLVMRWVTFPALGEKQAPPVPAPHPDAAPSGAPRGVKRRDLLEFQRVVTRLCARGNQCRLECCGKLHGNNLADQRVSPWARDEARRLLHTHPYDLLPRDYHIRRYENVERVWRAGLVRQVERWMEWYDSGESSAQGTQEGPRDTGGPAEGGGAGSGVDSALAASAQEKARRSPTAYALSESSTTGSVTAQKTSSSGSGDRPAPHGESSGKSGSDKMGPSRPALEKLVTLAHRLCRLGDSCPSLQGQGQRDSCRFLHSANIKALDELPPCARETALTFLRSHPSADLEPGEYHPLKEKKSQVTDGLERLARRWVDNPELVETEAPAVPAPHPDAAPSGAPSGVKRRDLLELKRLVLRLGYRGTKQYLCAKGVCNTLHPGLTTSQGFECWARDELERMVQKHPYQHVTPGDEGTERCEAVEWVWRAGLIRQVDKWIEWHDSGEGPAQGLDGGPRGGAGRAKGAGGASGVDGAPAASAGSVQERAGGGRTASDGGPAASPGARKRPRSPSADTAGKSTTTASTTAQETSSHGGGRREGLGQPAVQGTGSCNSDGNTSEGPSRPPLEELLGVVDRVCLFGDGCFSLQGQGQAFCRFLHSADIKALEELPPWARETALTFMGAHPFAGMQHGESTRDNWHKAGTAWKKGSKELVRR
jgi:hypothetical protein